MWRGPLCTEVVLCELKCLYIHIFITALICAYIRSFVHRSVVMCIEALLRKEIVVGASIGGVARCIWAFLYE